MRLHSLTLNNFKVLKGNRTYKFPSGVAGITGANGSGKSTLLNAIAYAFYGPSVLPGGKENVVTWGEDYCSVQLYFEIDGQEYNINRTQKSNGTSSAALLTAGDDGEWVHVTTGLEPITRSVEETLGVDRVGFLVSVFSRQEELAGLSSLTPATRMKTVLRLLGIERITAAIDTLRSDARALRKGIDVAKLGLGSPDEIRRQIASIESDSAKIQEDINRHQNNATQAQQEITVLDKEIATLLEQQQAYERYQRAERAVQSATEALGEAQSGAEHGDPGPEPPTPDAAWLANLRRSLASVEGKELNISDAIDKSECPCCGRPYENSNPHELREQLEKLVSTEQGIRIQIRDQEQLELDHASWRERKRLSETHSRWLLTAQSKLDSALAEFKSLEQVNNPSDELQKAHATLRQATHDTMEAELAIGMLRDRLSDLTGATERLAGALARAEAAADQIAADERTLRATEIAANEMVQTKEDMIGQIIPTLNERASALISEMTDARYTELTLTNDYEIQYRNYLGELKDFSNLSGGEQDVFALALRLALADVQADRIGVLILDEVMESLDTDRQELAWYALNNLTRRYNQILVVTHVPDFKERALHSITI